MAVVIFYEKQGCATNARQKLALRKAGHTLVSRNLLTTTWTPTALTPFFSGTPVASWFNRASPRIKTGEVVPEDFAAADALVALSDDPLLIRRPLVHVDGQCCAGFDREPVLSLLGTRSDEAPIDGCSHPDRSCPEPAEAPETGGVG